MGLSTVTLLVLSNLSTNRKALRKALEEDFDLLFFDSTDAALTQLRKKLPDAILLDHSLGAAIVYDFVEKVRNKPVTRNLPFIVVAREADNAHIERAVRAGVSHYVGIPFERKMLVEKVYFALTARGGPEEEVYFELPGKFETKIVSFGRISYISPEGIHFETDLKLAPETRIHISSLLSESLKAPSLEVKVKAVSTDTFYNHPFAVDADWADEKVRKGVTDWIAGHRHLNSPKKAKILIVHPELEFQEKFAASMDLSSYSVRSVDHLAGAIEDLAFMRPVCLVLEDREWKSASPVQQQKFLSEMKKHNVQWIVFGAEGIDTKKIQLKVLHSPAAPESIAMAVREAVPPLKPDPDRLYFSKILEDSRLKIYFEGQTLVLGELGVRLALTEEIVPPCNFQLSLKLFSEENLRNPFVRTWPPVTRVSTADSEKGKFKFSVQTHFLGINDQQAQAIRQWLHREELKERAKLIQAVPPKRGDEAPQNPK